MNLRIEGQQLRFRISKDELEMLCSGSDITQSTYFPKMRVLEITITPQDIEPILQLVVDGDKIVLTVQKQAVLNLYQALPSREGIQANQTLNAKKVLELSMEVDIRTQKRKRSNHAS
ncbi:MAG: hypothetical protein KDD76_01550 [Rickettsiales bacterium]|nr:hypothetical protein [Rickettsiales bacterium]